ncbi:MAG: nuclear transport factor 2 family protein [Thermoleophilia bacterium]
MAVARSAAELVDRIAECYTSRRWDDLRALFHPDARLVTSVGGPYDGPGTVEQLRRAMDDVNYRPPAPGELRIAGIDDAAALATGYVRVPASGGHKVVSRTWLYTIRDDLVYRALALPDERTARSRYAAEGVALGL